MEITTASMIAMLGLVGGVIVIAALLSGFIEKSSFPQVAAFLVLGAVLGVYGLGILNIGLDSSILRVVATVALVLVLFTDALTLDLGEVKKHSRLAFAILGPSTLLCVGVIMLAAIYLLKLPPAAAAVLAAPLASTDPVLLRGLLRRPHLPTQARQALRLESGLNDIVLLPIVLVAMAYMGGEQPNLGQMLLRILILGPAAGVCVAGLGIAALSFMRKQVGVRRDYESLYSLGLALAAFSAAEAMHGSGFLAAFAAGLTIAALDVELCDCFREYGETTAEMLLLLTFVLLGGALIWSGLSSVTFMVAAFVVVAIAARPLSVLLSLSRAKMPRQAKAIITWFGPRGLSTLLLVLVPVFEGVPGSEGLFHICSVVVLLSVVIHGGSLMGLRDPKIPAAPKPVGEAGIPLVSDDVELPEKVSAPEVRRMIDEGKPVIVVDARSTNSYLDSEEDLAASIRIDPEQARRSAEKAGIPKEAWVALFCT